MVVILKSETVKVLNENCFLLGIVDDAFLKKYDEICFSCEKLEMNSKILSEKVRKLKQIKKNLEKRVRIYDFLNELDGYAWLENNEHYDIQFIQAKKQKTPDLKAKDKNRQDVYTEIKTIRLGQEEEKCLAQSGPRFIINGNRNWEEGLEKKIREKVEEAQKQFKSVGAKNKILILFYSVGIDCCIYSQNKKHLDDWTLDYIFGEKFFESYDMKIIRLSI